MKILKGHKNRKEVVQINPDTNEVIAIFASLSEAARETGANIHLISRVCRQIPHHITAGGFKWRFVNYIDKWE